MGGGGAIALGTIRKILSEVLRDALPPRLDPHGPPRELVVAHLVGAFMGVLSWWLEGGAIQSPEEVDRIFRRLAGEGLDRAVNPDQVRELGL